jgi:hypothetical protein
MLKGIPTENHLARIYYELAQLGADSMGERRPWPYKARGLEELFVLGAEMSRYDPRLLGLLVSFLEKNWQRFNPLALRSLYESMRAPQVIAVMAEFLLRHSSRSEEKRHFLEYLQMGLNPVPLQFFFHHLYSPAGHLMQKAVEAPLLEYKRWGFLAREAPILDEAGRRVSGSRDAASRKNLLLRLLDERGRISLGDYIEALDHLVSRQQALLDIKSISGIRLVGGGRGARWERAA